MKFLSTNLETSRYSGISHTVSSYLVDSVASNAHNRHNQVFWQFRHGAVDYFYLALFSLRSMNVVHFFSDSVLAFQRCLNRCVHRNRYDWELLDSIREAIFLLAFELASSDLQKLLFKSNFPSQKRKYTLYFFGNLLPREKKVSHFIPRAKKLLTIFFYACS